MSKYCGKQPTIKVTSLHSEKNPPPNINPSPPPLVKILATQMPRSLVSFHRMCVLMPDNMNTDTGI